MAIIYKSNGAMDRQLVCDYLEKKKSENPLYRVLDVGGSANNWCDRYVDAYVDVVPSPGKRTFIGDINSDDVWNEILKEPWDYCICTHVLEDIRNPGFVIERMQQCASAGFISMPNKHSELSHVESRFFVGWSHHRWIYTIVGEELKAIAKMPIVNFFSPKNSLCHCLGSLSLFRFLARHRTKFIPAIDGRLRWLDKTIAGGRFELAFIWEGDFPFSYINDDFAGTCTDDLAKLYLDELAAGL